MDLKGEIFVFVSMHITKYTCSVLRYTFKSAESVPKWQLLV